MKRLVLMSSVIAMAIIITACAGTTQPTPKRGDTLFQQLGGEIGVDQLVVATLQRVHSDERIAFLFEDIDETNLVEQLYDQICYLSGGPCTYDGLDMRDAHAGMAITKREFDIFVQLFVDAMEQQQIPFSAQNKLLALLAPMRPDIVHQ